MSVILAADGMGWVRKHTIFRESTGIEVLLSEDVTLIAVDIPSFSTVVAVSTALSILDQRSTKSQVREESRF